MLVCSFSGLNASGACTPLWRPREKKIAIFDFKKRENKFLAAFFFFNFGSSKPWIRIRIHDTGNKYNGDGVLKFVGLTSVLDSDPCVFGPHGFASVSHKYGS